MIGKVQFTPDHRARVDFVQSLRGIAALLVTAFHIIKEAGHQHINHDEYIYQFGTTLQFGVDIFFIISGFIMVYVTHGRPTGPREGAIFLGRRFLRVAPLYWIFTLLTAAMMVITPDTMNATHIDVPYLAASLSFIPWPNQNNTGLLPVLGLGWTLNYEVFFYLIFTVLITSAIKRRITILCIILVLLVLFGQRITIDYPQIWYWTRSTILQFGFGAILASLFLNNRILVSESLALAIFIAALVLWQVDCWSVTAFDPDLRGYFLGVPAAAAMLGIMCSRRLVRFLEGRGSTSVFQRIGDASYSLYLGHMFILRMSSVILIKFVPSIPFPLFFVVATVTCVAGALLVHRWVERPLLRLGNRAFAGKHNLAAAKPIIGMSASPRQMQLTEVSNKNSM